MDDDGAGGLSRINHAGYMTEGGVLTYYGKVF